jgi:hypothetical protein
MFTTNEKFINTSITAAIIGSLLNIALASMSLPLATDDEVSPPNGAANLPIKSQLMHMLVHHNQVLLTSSAIVFALVFLSTNLALSL